MREFFTSRRKLVCIGLGTAFSLGLNQKAYSGMPIPQEIPLDDYLKSYGTIIASGSLRKVVYMDAELADSLIKGEIPSASKLKFTERIDLKNIGATFLEIFDLELILIKKSDEFSSSLTVCRYDKIYCPGHFISNHGEAGDYYRSLIGKKAIFFLSSPSRYGENLANFPSPFFKTSPGTGNWRDGRPLPFDRIDDVKKSALREGYATPKCSPVLSEK